MFDADYSNSDTERLNSKPPLQSKSILKNAQPQQRHVKSPPPRHKHLIQTKTPDPAKKKIRSQSNTPTHCKTRLFANSPTNEKKLKSLNKKRKSSVESTIGLDECPVQKVFKEKVSLKYINGSEPKIINEITDPQTGKYIYFISLQ